MNRALLQDRLDLAVRAALHGLQEMQPKRSLIQWCGDSLWAELVACLLGSAVPFTVAHAFAEHLRRGGFLSQKAFQSDPDTYEQRLATELGSPLPVTDGAFVAYRRYRFPRLRASHICRTACRLQKTGPGLQELLESCDSEAGKRRRLVETCVGIGPKQASLFLRNTGHPTDLAILDVHVLRFIRIAVCGEPVSPPGGCLRTYERIERRLRKYAEGLGARLAQLDTAIWVAMRVMRQEAPAWL